MKTGLKARFRTWMLMLAVVPCSLGQTTPPVGTGPNAPLSSTGPALAPVEAQTPVQSEARSKSQASAEIFREIDDPRDGARWLLSRDLSHPGGPGVLAQTGGESPSQAQRLKTGVRPAEKIPVPVIRAGDRLILEEHSAVVEGRLEAIALAPAAVGSVVSVRLIIGGKVVRARALASGRVDLKPETEGRP
jgi:hypothetical protein